MFGITRKSVAMSIIGGASAMILMSQGTAAAATGNINSFLQEAPTEAAVEMFTASINQSMGVKELPDSETALTQSEKDAMNATKVGYTTQSDLIPLVEIAKVVKISMINSSADTLTEDEQGAAAEFAGQQAKFFVDTTGYVYGPGEIDALTNYMMSGGPVNPEGVKNAFRTGLGV